MTKKQKLGVIAAVVGLLGIQAVFFSSPRLDPMLYQLGLCVSLPMCAVLLLAVLLHTFRKEKEIWISLPAFLLFLPIVYPWPMAIMMKLHEDEILAYIESGSQESRRIGTFRFVKADARRRCAITADTDTGPHGIWRTEGKPSSMWFGYVPLLPQWYFASED